VTGAGLSGATRSSQRRAGISHKSISAGIGSSLWKSRWRYCDCFSLRECGGGRNPGDYGYAPQVFRGRESFNWTLIPDRPIHPIRRKSYCLNWYLWMFSQKTVQPISPSIDSMLSCGFCAHSHHGSKASFIGPSQACVFPNAGFFVSDRIPQACAD
jgi:hypothetical protein